MSDYWLSEAGDRFRSQVNRRWPNRDLASDGWISDASHAASISDHNPCWTCGGASYGVVRAVDIDASIGGPAGYNSTDDSWALANQLRKAMIGGDKRVSYIIAFDPDKGRDFICSMNAAYQPLGVWRDYTGDSHVNHVHVSFTAAGDFNDRRFDLPIFDTTAVPQRLLEARDTLLRRTKRQMRRLRKVKRQLSGTNKTLRRVRGRIRDHRK